MRSIRGESLPFLGQLREESARADVLRDFVANLTVPHELDPIHGVLDGLATGVVVGDTTLAFVRYGAPARMTAEPSGSAICWVVPIGPMSVSSPGQHETRYRDGFVLGRESPTVLVPSTQEGAVFVTTTEERLREYRLELTGEDSSRMRVQSGPGRLPNSGVVDAAWQYVDRVLAMWPRPSLPMLATFEQLLLSALMIELPLALAPELRTVGTRASSAIHVRRAVAWARTRVASRITMDEWAAATGISVRHLQKVFQDVHGCTPVEYLLTMRLTRARQLLQHPGEESSVAQIAEQVGLRHLGRFASAYKDRFDELPSQTRRRGAAVR
ncbi:helix-turn-helix domain-containing protein [Epidermidibacterium keratini]|uniref:Helix-turn-helix domain-containing protein n=1 Tax=Epidermidibacterium keratini TaxID=1891644 RepID=A0A7L4YM87_9ACTN|nr:helix-turn-helix transcriptional regulator [Epidermidibacterium keratini]QHB99933.1 helix-turn-helix domain-containing protein [Epidermidibacterium keratini]